jgi:menaquinone-dependent protoporphyrinogen oxidase
MEEKTDAKIDSRTEDAIAKAPMKRILVAYGSKRGSTAEIAERIAQILRRKGAEVDVFPAGQVRSVSKYDLVIIGSAVYIGLWRREVVTFMRRYQEELGALPLWIFSSGPTEPGDPLEAIGTWRYPRAVAPFFDRHPPADSTCFGGSIDPRKSSYFEKNMIRRARVPVGDYRDWDAIDAWAERIPVTTV